MAQSPVRPKRILDRRPIELSQMEMLGSDVDITELDVFFDTHLVGDISRAIYAGDISRTIDGASTLTISVDDDDRLLLRSGNLNNKLDVQINGLWWRLREVDKSGGNLDLKFEDREVAVLRTYSKVIPPVSRGSITRAEFVLRMIQEVNKEYPYIPWYIPDLHKIMPIDQSKSLADLNYGNPDNAPGINSKEKLTVDGNSATNDQKNNANAILTTGNGMMSDSYPHKRKILVCSIMAALQESRLINTPIGPGDHKGLFQQSPSSGWPDTLDVVEESTAFFNAAIKVDKSNPNLSYNDLCQNVEASDKPRGYAKWRVEAEQYVIAFGISGGDNIDPKQQSSDNNQDPNASDPTAGLGLDNYYFYRGKAPTQGQVGIQPENAWDCIQRLAQEVNWRAYFVSGRFYWINEKRLFRQMPVAVLSEDADGVISIDGNYDQNKKIASVTVECLMGRFGCPPGSIIKLEDMGVFNGRWLVETIDRDLFTSSGTLNLKKSDPILPEPATGTVPSQFGTGQPTIIIPGNTSKRQSATKTQIPPGSVQGLVQEVLNMADAGKFRDDRGTVIPQFRKLAEGQRLTNQCGDPVSIDIKIPQMILYMIQNGWYLGSFALCEDHTCYVSGRPGVKSQHAVGQAIDISSIGQENVGWRNLSKNDILATEWIKKVMILLRDMNPSQIICNGNGFVNPDIQKLQWNNGQQVSYITDDHTDHIHFGA